MNWKFWQRNREGQEQTSSYNTNPTDREIDIINQLDEIKEAAIRLMKGLKETATLNLIYGNMVSILVNYDLTKEQRKDILHRFSNVDTLSDALDLHEEIVKELKEKQEKGNIQNNEK